MTVQNALSHRYLQLSTGVKKMDLKLYPMKVMEAMADMNPNLEEVGRDTRKQRFSRKI